MKVKPMINGIEVKVGQFWRDVGGSDSEITFIDEEGCFTDEYDVYYNRFGKSVGGVPDNDLFALIEGVDTVDSFSAKLRQVQATVQPKATFTESEINAKINQVIKEFDWQRAFSVYNALNWTWYTSQGIPTIGALVVSGIELMKEAVEIAVNNQDEGYASFGGLIGRAYITDGKLTVSLEMQVTEASSGY